MIKIRVRSALFGAALVSIAAIGFNGAAVAGSACTDAAFGVPSGTLLSGYYLTSVVTNSGCQLGSTAKDGPPNGTPPAQVNADSMFGNSDWVVFQATISNVGATSGSWNLGSNFFSLFGQAMLVFTDGQGTNIKPVDYVGYLINLVNGTSGTWTSPYNNGTNLTNVSDFTVYARGAPRETSPVPLPGAIWLLFAALSSLGVFGWVKRRAAA